MITVLIHHWVKPEHKELLNRLCLESGDDQSKWPGFVNRHVWAAMDNPLKITTVTTWRSKAHRDAWWKDALSKGPNPEEANIYTRPNEDEWWDVLEGQTITGSTS